MCPLDYNLGLGSEESLGILTRLILCGCEPVFTQPQRFTLLQQLANGLAFSQNWHWTASVIQKRTVSVDTKLLVDRC